MRTPSPYTILYYNFCRIHQSLEITPAMAAGVTTHLYDIDWIVGQIADRHPEPKRPKTYCKPRMVQP